MIDGATILVADDSPDDVELLKRAILEAGIKNPVQHASDGEEVITYLKNGVNRDPGEFSCPLLMFLDLNMPRCTGFAVLDWLRQQPDLQNLPTIIFSSSEQPSDIENSLRLGAHSYWVKPSKFEDLVSRLIDLKEVLRRVARKIELKDPISVAA